MDEKLSGSVDVGLYPCSDTSHGQIVVDWNGPDDPENPRNWARSRKWIISVFGFWFLTLVGASTAGYAIAQPSLEKDLGISHFVGTLGIVVFTIPFGGAPLVLAPCSELFGRLPVYIVSSAIFWMMFLPQALAKNIETVLITRFISGVGASTSVSIVGGMLADMWDTSERGFPMAIFSFVAFAGTGLGPVAFGYVELKFGYVLINWILFGISGLSTIGVVLVSRETRASVLLIRKARSLREVTGNNSYRAKAEEDRISVGRMLRISFLRPLRMLLTEPVLFIFAVWITYAWGIIYLMLEAIPLVFTRLYHFNSGENGLIFAGQIIGPMLGMVANIWCDRAYQRDVAQRGAEARLYIAMGSGILLPIGCWIYSMKAAVARGRMSNSMLIAWTSFPSITWFLPALAICIIYAAMFGIYLASFNYVTDSYTVYASSALGGQSAVRLVIGSNFSLLAQPMYNSLGIHLAGTIIAVLSTAFVITPFLLYRYGAALRAKSKFAQELSSSGHA